VQLATAVPNSSNSSS